MSNLLLTRRITGKARGSSGARQRYRENGASRAWRLWSCFQNRVREEQMTAICYSALCKPGESLRLAFFAVVLLLVGEAVWGPWNCFQPCRLNLAAAIDARPIRAVLDTLECFLHRDERTVLDVASRKLPAFPSEEITESIGSSTLPPCLIRGHFAEAFRSIREVPALCPASALLLSLCPWLFDMTRSSAFEFTSLGSPVASTRWRYCRSNRRRASSSHIAGGSASRAYAGGATRWARQGVLGALATTTMITHRENRAKIHPMCAKA